MITEYEATFLDVDKDEVRGKLKKIGAKLIKKEFLQKRFAFNLPEGLRGPGKWVRVRDEKDRITMSYKFVSGKKIEDQKEITLIVDDFDNAVEFLEKIGCQKKSYQENKREIWLFEDVEVCIDEWPFLEPYLEIEADSEEKVKRVSRLLDFDYSEAKFCATGRIYAEKYKNVSLDYINNKIKKIVFDMQNPFLEEEIDS